MRTLKGERLEKELERLEAMRSFEREYEACSAICGIDEAGRGPLAGPVAAAAVILPKDCVILYLNDSKKLSPARRDALFDEIMEKAVAYHVGIVSPERIDEINILQATYEAMRKAGEPLNAGKVAELTGLDRKVVDKAFAELKKEGAIVSPVRCKWEPANK